jgi:hypothetical protein
MAPDQTTDYADLERRHLARAVLESMDVINWMRGLSVMKQPASLTAPCFRPASASNSYARLVAQG